MKRTKKHISIYSLESKKSGSDKFTVLTLLPISRTRHFHFHSQVISRPEVRSTSGPHQTYRLGYQTSEDKFPAHSHSYSPALLSSVEKGGEIEAL